MQGQVVPSIRSRDGISWQGLYDLALHSEDTADSILEIFVEGSAIACPYNLVWHPRSGDDQD